MTTPKNRNTQDRATFYIQKIVETIKKHDPKRILLFGSRARGDNQRTSDIDIAVDLDLPFRERRKLKEEIEEVSGLYSVDLLFLPEVNERLKEKILKEGKVLYEKK